MDPGSRRLLWSRLVTAAGAALSAAGRTGDRAGGKVGAVPVQSDHNNGCAEGRGDELAELSELKCRYGSYCTAAVACFLDCFSDVVSAV